MTIIHTYLSPAEVKRLSQRDNDYFSRKLDDNCMLNNLLNKSINRPLLAELRCVLDNKPLVRRKAEQHDKNSKVKVFNADGRLIRIERGSGKVLKVIV